MLYYTIRNTSHDTSYLYKLLELEFTVLPIRGCPTSNVCNKHRLSAQDFHWMHMNESWHNDSMHYNRRSEIVLTNTEILFRVLRIRIHGSLLLSCTHKSAQIFIVYCENWGSAFTKIALLSLFILIVSTTEIATYSSLQMKLCSSSKDSATFQQLIP